MYVYIIYINIILYWDLVIFNFLVFEIIGQQLALGIIV